MKGCKGTGRVKEDSFSGMVTVVVPTKKIPLRTYLCLVATIFIGLGLVVNQDAAWIFPKMQTVHEKKRVVDLSTIRRETIQGTDVLFAEPSSNVKGILFVAHGCSHSNTDWFVDCEGCIGLPEERAIVQIGLDHGLVVVAISSSNRNSKCWNLSTDVQPLGNVLLELSKRYQTHGSVPIFAFGASSGGAFVSTIATPLKEGFGLRVDGFLSQIAAVQNDESTPCQVYITMNRDKRTDTNAKFLVENTTTNTKIKRKQFRIPPLPIPLDYFSSRIPEITLEQSTKIVESFHAANMLDPNGYLLDDPRRTLWREALSTIPGLEHDSLVADKSSISEVMNVAYGMHEMTRDGVEEALEFCLGSS